MPNKFRSHFQRVVECSLWKEHFMRYVDDCALLHKYLSRPIKELSRTTSARNVTDVVVRTEQLLTVYELPDVSVLEQFFADLPSYFVSSSPSSSATQPPPATAEATATPHLPAIDFWCALRKDMAKVESHFAKVHSESSGRLMQIVQQLDALNRQEMKRNHSTLKQQRKLKALLEEQFLLLHTLNNFATTNKNAFKRLISRYDTRTGAATLIAIQNTLHRLGVTFWTPEVVLGQQVRHIELLFSTQFTDGDLHAARQALRVPTVHVRDANRFFHMFLIGMFAGCSVALIFWATWQWSHTYAANWSQSSSVFLLYRLWFWPLLGLWYWGINITIWTSARINFIHVFEFGGSRKGIAREVFLIAAVGTFCWSLSIAVYVWSNTAASSLAFAPAWQPYLVSVLFVVCLLNPFNFDGYRAQRFRILHLMWRLCRAGCLPQVQFVEFFVADQLTSVLPMLEDALFHFCFLSEVGGEQQQCLALPLTYIRIAVDFLPSLVRLAQCLRRWRNEEGPHMANAGKYLTQAPVVVFFGLNALLSNGNFTVYTGFYAFFLFVANYYRLFWDYARDWSVLVPGVVGFPLRREIMFPAFTYYFAIVTNFLLRHTWCITFYTNPYPVIVAWPRAFNTFFGFLEVTRRFQWNFFRLENEHVNNTGRYRLVHDIPLLYDIHDAQSPLVRLFSALERKDSYEIRESSSFPVSADDEEDAADGGPGGDGGGGAGRDGADVLIELRNVDTNNQNFGQAAGGEGGEGEATVRKGTVRFASTLPEGDVGADNAVTLRTLESDRL